MFLRTMKAAASCIAVSFAVIACSDSDPVGPTGSEGPGYDSLTVNAAADWTYVTLGNPAQSVSPGDPASSSAWDLGLYATSVSLNGGAAGPGDVLGFCLCQNSSASDAEVRVMTGASELTDFTAVTAADIPDDSLWLSDDLSAAIQDWYAYDPQTHQIAPAGKVWVMRMASGEAFAKMHVTGISGGDQSAPGTVTVEWALQPSAGASFEATQAFDVDLSPGVVYFDLDAGAVVASGSPDWDLRFEGWDIRVNGGVSGSGQAGALTTTETFAEVADASEPPPNLFRGDAYGGVFAASPWYRYNLDGLHQIWPTFDVYLVKRGTSVFKVQLVSYYGEAGESREITFRYSPLS